MSQKTRTQLKSIFTQGTIPSQQDFEDFIDSIWNLSDDGSIAGATGPAGAIGATGPFLGGDFGELYSNGSTGSFSTGLLSGASWIWDTGIVGETYGTTGTNGVSGTTNASLQISNTGVYSVSVSSNLVVSGLTVDPITIQVLVNTATNPKLTFDVSYEKASWSAFYSFTSGDVITLKIKNPSLSNAVVSTGTLFMNIIQIK